MKINVPVFALGTALAMALVSPLSMRAQNASEALYKAKCASCHGASLGGGESAPPLTGGTFLSAFVTNQNDFALQQITLRCEYVTKDGPKVFSYKLSEVLEPVSLGPATINYVDHYLGAAPLDARDANCAADEVAVWSPGEDIQSRR